MQCVRAGTLYTGRDVRKDAWLLFDGKSVRGVSSRKRGDEAGSYPVVTPAFIDPHSHIGMHRAGEPGGEGETNERMDIVLALVDALDSVQMDDASFAEAVEAGVLYSCVVPGSGNLIGGRSAVVRHYAANGTDAFVARAGMKAAMGFNPKNTNDWKGKRPFTRMGSLAILRERFDAVRQKVEKRRKARGRKKDEFDLSAEERALADVLAGKERLRVHCHKIDDIAALLRLVDEWKLSVTVEHAADVHDGAIFRELAGRKIPVVYGPPDAFPYKVELKHESWQNVRLLLESGCDYGLMTDHPVTLSKMLFLQTRHFTRSGLSKRDAVELVTRRNAAILGLSRVLGTLARGKWASFVCWNGDPFDITSHPVAVYGEGARLYAE